MKRAGRIYHLAYGFALFGVYLAILMPVASGFAAASQDVNSAFFTCGWFTQQQQNKSPSADSPAGADELCFFCKAACHVTFVIPDEIVPVGPTQWPVEGSIPLPPDQSPAKVAVYRVLNRGPPVA
ncbi:hypothetical protein [Aestuariispira ectoiniformans]|uniref:hypothetical protein n=1 Tax=Aestuariispira ectoiniformans TaxID=2775080 RepID=UPI00223B7E71|nr:hypothetical protein [Aestuariispira ectoiniformans]